MALQTLSQTENFTFTYLDSIQFGPVTIPLPNRRERAEALYESCENDFKILKEWFGIKDGFGASNRITVQVQPDSFAHNYRYKSDGSSLITVNPFDNFPGVQGSIAGASPVDPAILNETVRMLFVAEAIEILMDYNNKKSETWRPDYSDGEALSRVAAATLHPTGYYNTLIPSPFVNAWLQGPRTANWVATREPTDGDADSFGCAILFIYYLWYQLNIDILSIVRKAGATLEETYQALTGETQGFIPFRDLLNKYLPYDANNPSKQMKSLKTDNPFPILEGAARQVRLSFKEVTDPVGLRKLGEKESRRGHVTVAPFFTCPAKSYGYTVVDLDQTLRCMASVEGFAQPKFAWKVNGLQASVGGSISPTTTVLVDDPAHPDQPKSESKLVRIYWQDEKDASTSAGRAGELDLHNPANGYDGHEELNVQVEVSETFGTTDSTSSTGFTTLDTQEVVYDAAFYADRADCISRFTHTIGEYVRVSQIPLVFTLPDPAPEIRAAMRFLRELISELRSISTKNPELGSRLAKALAQALQLPEHMLSLAGKQVESRSATAE